MKPLNALALSWMISLLGCTGEDPAALATGTQADSTANSTDIDNERPTPADEGDGPEASGDGPMASPDQANTDGDSAGDLEEPQGEACCAAHAAPGCADQAIMDCVCADDVLPQCCTEAWTEVCVEIVRQRFCDPGVRECVCDEWEQSGCCESDWTQNFCDVVATTKCEASVGCGS